LRGGRIEITVEGVSEQFLKDMKIADGNVRSLPNGVLLDVPEEKDPNSVIDAVRSAKGTIVSVVPRKKRLEDLFVETVTNKPATTKPTIKVEGGVA
jgi:ABC-2 type transport system ATP-binding protein